MATAQGIISVVTANMAKAIRVISVQRGHDPRDYALLPSAGQGRCMRHGSPSELDMKRIVVPRNPGIGCALGLLLTDLRANFATTRLATLATAVADMAEIFAPCRRRPSTGSRRRASPRPTAGCAAPPTCAITARTTNSRSTCPTGRSPGDARALAEGFAEAHKRLYGFVAEGEAVQLVTYRLEAVGLVPKAEFRPQPDAGPDASQAIIGQPRGLVPRGRRLRRLSDLRPRRLKSGNRFAGPAIVEQMDTTTVLLPGMTRRRALSQPDPGGRDERSFRFRPRQRSTRSPSR
jgi:N-methylhydantoinase A